MPNPDPPTTEPALSVVVPAHDAAATLAEQLDALTAQRWDRPFEILVVDNGSTDATPEIVREHARRGPALRLVAATERSGPAYARNVGAAAARAPALAFCDADDVVAPGWVAAIGDALGAHELVCGPVELHRLNPGWLADSRGSPGTVAAVRFDDRFPFASSCNLGVTRARFEQVGGFDESLHVGEDIDFSMRLHLAGVPLAFVPDAVVHYRYRPTLRATFDRAVAYGASRPVLAERWRARTGEQLARAPGARNYLWLVRHAPELRTAAGRARWLWVAGQRVGALRGGARVRRFYA